MRRVVMQPRGSERTRPAFTLLELVIASALSVIVLVTIVNAVGMVYRVENVADARLNRVRLAKGLLDRLEDDLQSVVMPTEITASTDQSDLLADVAAEIESIITPTEPTASETLQPLVGTATTLTLLVEPMRTASEYAAAELDQLEALGDVTSMVGTRRRVVVWDAGQLPPVETGDDEPVVRSELVPLTADEDAATLSSPELVDLTFEYCDAAGAWTTDWGAAEGDPLPIAVRATLTLTTGEQDTSLSSDTITFVRLISLPAGRFDLAEDEGDE